MLPWSQQLEFSKSMTVSLFLLIFHDFVALMSTGEIFCRVFLNLGLCDFFSHDWVHGFWGGASFLCK